MDESVDLEVNFKVKPFARFGLPGFVEVKIQEEGLLSRYEDKPIPRHSGGAIPEDTPSDASRLLVLPAIESDVRSRHRCRSPSSPQLSCWT